MECEVVVVCVVNGSSSIGTRTSGLALALSLSTSRILPFLSTTFAPAIGFLVTKFSAIEALDL